MTLAPVKRVIFNKGQASGARPPRLPAADPDPGETQAPDPDPCEAEEAPAMRPYEDLI